MREQFVPGQHGRSETVEDWTDSGIDEFNGVKQRARDLAPEGLKHTGLPIGGGTADLSWSDRDE